MLDLFDEIYENKSKNNKPAIIFLDIKKAFDTVNHNILIKKLEYYGIGGTVLKWFKNYLTGRYQCTKVCGNCADCSYVWSVNYVWLVARHCTNVQRRATDQT